MKNNLQERIHKYWEEQAVKYGVSAEATQPDIHLRDIETKAILRNIDNYPNDSILDVGCGNGITVSIIHKKFPDSTICGVDYCEHMIEAAHSVCPQAEFRVLDVTKDILEKQSYDIILTQRCIINIPEWSDQLWSMMKIVDALKPGGIYIMAEAFTEPLLRLNLEREKLDLPAIQMKWHNQYLSDEKVSILCGYGLEIMHVDEYSGTYFLLTRVVSPGTNNNPTHMDPINHVATLLEPMYETMSIQKVYVLRKL